MPVPSCRFFNGYKPCAKNSLCDESCPQLSRFSESILIVHLGALGAVARSTSLLAAIKRKHPGAKVVWITEKSARPLLEFHPDIDLVVSADFEALIELASFHFKIAYVIDKSLKAAGLAQSLNCERILGFTAHHGAILPATPAAAELWYLGLDDEQKFFVNEKSETQLIAEALELPFVRDPYFLPLTPQEEKQVRARKKLWSQNQQKILVGINTGCGAVIPYKKLSVSFQRRLIDRLLTNTKFEIVLLGGPEDEERNRQIAEDLPVISSPTQSGLRDGLISIAACDIVVTGDSLGLHLAIAQKKWVVAWFGPTCAQEIDLYDHGVKILSGAACAPCWKRTCQKELMCYDQVSLDEIAIAVQAAPCALVKEGIQPWPPTSSSKPPFSEMSS